MTIATDARPKKRPGRKGAVGELLPVLMDADLRALLQRDVLRSNQVLPPTECILVLAKELSLLRLIVSPVGQKVLTKPHRELQNIITALRGIVRISPSFLDRIQHCIARNEGRLIGLFESDLSNDELNDKVTSIHSSIRELKVRQFEFLELTRVCNILIGSDCYGLFGNKAPVYSWHDIAHKLAADFRLAMHPSNPNLKMGQTRGPIPRFIVSVVPHITGERLNLEQVGKYLRDNPLSP